MYNPKQVLTTEGHRRYLMHLENVRAAWEFLENHNDDLHLFAIDPDLTREDAFYMIEDMMDSFENGPFEDDDR